MLDDVLLVASWQQVLRSNTEARPNRLDATCGPGEELRRTRRDPRDRRRPFHRPFLLQRIHVTRVLRSIYVATRRCAKRRRRYVASDRDLNPKMGRRGFDPVRRWNRDGGRTLRLRECPPF